MDVDVHVDMDVDKHNDVMSLDVDSHGTITCNRDGCCGLCLIHQRPTPPALEFYLGAVVDLKGSPPCVAPSS